jgi:fluoroquinolone transport system permease protein
MTRFPATLWRDIIQQNRYGLYAISGAMVLVWGVLLSLLLRNLHAGAAVLVPAFVVFNLIITTFYFMAALLLLERDEGMLSVIITTPLRDVEYLASKVVSLTVLALAESLLIVILLFGVRAQWGPLLAGATLLGAQYVLLGFMSVVRYDSINEWLMPSVAVVIILVLPLLAHFGFVSRQFFYLHPTWPALRLVQAAYIPVGGGEIVLAGGGAALWLGLMFVWARRRFRRFVILTATA